MVVIWAWLTGQPALMGDKYDLCPESSSSVSPGLPPQWASRRRNPAHCPGQEPRPPGKRCQGLHRERAMLCAWGPVHNLTEVSSSSCISWGKHTKRNCGETMRGDQFGPQDIMMNNCSKLGCIVTWDLYYFCIWCKEGETIQTWSKWSKSNT